MRHFTLFLAVCLSTASLARAVDDLAVLSERVDGTLPAKKLEGVDPVDAGGQLVEGNQCFVTACVWSRYRHPTAGFYCPMTNCTLKHWHGTVSGLFAIATRGFALPSVGSYSAGGRQGESDRAKRARQTRRGEQMGAANEARPRMAELAHG